MSKFTKALSDLFLAVPLRMLAIICAGLVQTGMTIFVVLIVWHGGWAVVRQEQQLSFLGWTLILMALSTLVIIGSLTSSKIKGHGPGGVAFEVEGDSPAAAKVTTTTTVEAPKGNG